jgi:DNA-binding LacI/PurR family transcriptional regulator
VKDSVKIVEVAKLAGVSAATVSRVLNSPELVALSTALKVNRTMDQLGYRPNPYARGLKGSARKTVGLIFLDDLSKLARNPFWALASNAVYASLLENQFNPQIVTTLNPGNSTPRFSSSKDLVRFLRNGHCDGYITIGSAADQFWSGLWGSKLPSIAWGPPGPEKMTIPTIDTNNAGGGALAVHHLFEKGYRRIAHISATQGFITSDDRLLGFLQAKKSLGLPSDPALVRVGNGGYESGWEHTEALMQIDDPPDAIFAHSDEVAFGVLRYAEANGLRVPGDLAIVGFDNVGSEMKILGRAITSVATPYREIGSALAHGIGELMDGRHFSSRVIDALIFDGDST